MKRGIGDGDTADKHRREFGDRRELAGTSHLHFNRLYGGELFLCRVFVRHCPTRLAADHAHARLHVDVIDLVDHAIDVKRQTVALRSNVVVKSYQACCALHFFAVLRHRKAPAFQGKQHLQMAAVDL